jgi:hypothetical protein
MILFLCHTTLLNFYMLLCEKNALKQNTVHSSIAYDVQILLYNVLKHISMLMLRRFRN